MRLLSTASILLLSLSLARAQNCPDTVLGTALGANPTSFDQAFAVRPIGFAFPLGGTTYTDLHITTKGMCYLSNGGVPAPGQVDYTATAAELAGGPPRIAAFWSDIGPGVYGEVYCRSTATKCTVTWQNAVNYGGSGASFDVQVQLFPNGVVKVFHSPGTVNASTFSGAAATAIVGVSPGGVAVPPAASNFASAGGTIAATVFESWNANGFDLAGNSLQLGPAVPTGWVWSPATATVCASSSDYGRGCPAAGPDSFHQTFAPGTADLSNQRLQMTRSTIGYVVTTGLAAGSLFHTPGPGAIVVAPGQLDGQQLFVLSSPMPTPTGAATTLNVCSKGYLQFQPSSSLVDFTPSAADLLANPQTTFACWYDYDQTSPGSGAITFEEVGAMVYVTWAGVHGFQSTTPSTFQFQCNRSTGDVTLVFGAFTPLLHPTVVGYSAGGASTDPGPIDLSVGATLSIRDVQFFGSPLTSTAANAPALGNPAFAIRTSNVPNLIGLGFLFLGDTQLPPVPLDAFGLPDCRSYTNGNLGTFSFPVAQPQGVGDFVFAVPNNPLLVGSVLTSQSVALSLITPSNLITSNGTEIVVGW